MDSKAIGTNASNDTEQRLARLERAIWILVILLSCVLAASIVACVWVSAWGEAMFPAPTTLHGGA